MRISFRRRRQVYGALIGLVVSSVLLTIFFLPENEDIMSLGPANTGHEELACNDCHSPAPGDLLGQITANVQYYLGTRRTMADFGHLPVDTKKCQGCHDRPNDRHPVHRFKEPRFADARKAIDATECASCHLEHEGVRLTAATTTFCVNCHSDLKMKNDPLDVSHEELIQQEKWTTCLQCHDFHGNHMMKTADKMKDTIAISALVDYIKGGKDPFSEKKKYEAKRKPEEPLIENSYE